MLTSISIRAKDLFWLKQTRSELADWCIKVFRLNQIVVERNILPSAPVVRIASDEEFKTSGGFANPYFPIPDKQPDLAYIMYAVAEILDLGWEEGALFNAKVVVIFRDTRRTFCPNSIGKRYVVFKETSSEYDLEEAVDHSFALQHLTIDATHDVGTNAYLYAFAKLFPFYNHETDDPEQRNYLDLVFQKTGNDDSDLILGRKLLAETLDTAPKQEQLYRGPYVMTQG